MDYTIIRLSLLNYLAYRINRHGFKALLSLTSTGYPRIFALGVCYHNTKEIVIAQVGNWQLREEHEVGHANGLRHTNKIGYVMHAYGFLRGNKYE